MNNVERAGEMMHIPIKNLPKLAVKYFQYMASKMGSCGEVYVTAYAHYAQIVEGLQCNDEEYDAESMPEFSNWLKKRISQKEYLKNSIKHGSVEHIAMLINLKQRQCYINKIQAKELAERIFTVIGIKEK